MIAPCMLCITLLDVCGIRLEIQPECIVVMPVSAGVPHSPIDALATEPLIEGTSNMPSRVALASSLTVTGLLGVLIVCTVLGPLKLAYLLLECSYRGKGLSIKDE